MYEARTVLLDIEAAGLPNVMDYYVAKTFEAPANYVDPAKIAAHIAKAETKDRADWEANAPLDIDCLRVVAIGTWWQGADRPGVMLCQDEAQEQQTLEAFWRMVGPAGLIVAFNGVGYDVPALLRRSLYLGIEAPHIEVGKYRHPRIIDPMLILSNDGAQKFKSQAWYLRRFGFVEPEDWTQPDITGAQVGERIAAGDWEAVSEHCRRDLHRLAFLAEKLKLWAVLPF